MDLTELFYAAGRKAALETTFNPIPPVTGFGLPKKVETSHPEAVSACSSHSAREIPNRQAAGCAFSRTIDTSSFKPVGKSLNGVRMTKTPIPPATGYSISKTNVTLLPDPVSARPSHEITIDQKVWSNLTDCLKLFVKPEVTTDMAKVQKLLETRLSEALQAVSFTGATDPPMDIPFDNLIKVCDVAGSDGPSIWNHGHAAIEAATSVLAGKTLWATCGTVPHAALWDVLGHEERTVSVHFGGCEDDVEEMLLCTGEFTRSHNMSDGVSETIQGGVLESLTCIRVQDAGHFWAYVGSEWPSYLEELDAVYEACDISDDELLGDDGGDVFINRRPKKDDVLLLAATDALRDDFTTSAVRVRVVDVQCDKALLWCLDLATYTIQKWNILRRCHKKMSRIPYQAKLCQIEGFVAKPSVSIVLKCCALLLKLLTCWTFTLKEATLTNFFTIFAPMSYGSLKALQQPALMCVCIGATLVGCEKLSSVKLNRLLDQYLERIGKLSFTNDISEESEKELITATQTVRNILFGFAELRAYFAKIGGFPAVARLVLTRKLLDGDLEMEVWKLLRVLSGAGDLRKEHVNLDRSVKVAQISPTQSIPERPAPKPHVPILPRRSMKYLLEEWKQAALEKKAEGENYTTKAPTHPRVSPVTPPLATQQADVGKREYLIRGKPFPFQPSDTVIIMPQRKINEITSLCSIQTVCGLLNSEAGGAIYFGIGPRNAVEGMYLMRKQRDDIRIGFDRLMDSWLSPRIGPGSCDLTYVKVFDCNEHKDLDRPQHALHVIRLEVKASPGTLHKLKSGQYFLIKNGVAKEARTQELREGIVRMAEKQFT